jgi:D-amino-acid dehydrogenase
VDVAVLDQCTAERAALNTTRKVRLCTYSQSVFHDTVAATGVDYDGRKGGILYFYRSPKAFEAAAAKSKILTDNGCDIAVLDRDGVVKVDPALVRVKERQIAGALYARKRRERRLPDVCPRACRLAAGQGGVVQVRHRR